MTPSNLLVVDLGTVTARTWRNRRNRAISRRLTAIARAMCRSAGSRTAEYLRAVSALGVFQHPDDGHRP